MNSEAVLAIEQMLQKISKPSIVAICGPSCSGKTTLSSHLAKKGVGNVLAMDAFYYPIPEIKEYLPGIPAFDSPQAFDMSLLVQCLENIRNGFSVRIPVYHYSRTALGRDAQVDQVFMPAKITLLDGILSFDESLKHQIDFAIYLEREPKARREARMRRDVAERGVDLIRAAEIYDKMSFPLFQKYGESQKQRVNIVLNNQ